MSVSRHYSLLKGIFPRVTHPCATNVLLHPFDLHVLGLPPAFVLSQDQTLKFESIKCPKESIDLVFEVYTSKITACLYTCNSRRNYKVMRQKYAIIFYRSKGLSRAVVFLFCVSNTLTYSASSARCRTSDTKHCCLRISSSHIHDVQEPKQSLMPAFFRRSASGPLKKIGKEIFRPNPEFCF